MKLRHIGLVVKDLEESVKLYRELGFKPVSRDTIRVVKMSNGHNTIELVKGRWKPHIAVNFYEDEDKNLWEVVCLKN